MLMIIPLLMLIIVIITLTIMLNDAEHQKNKLRDDIKELELSLKDIKERLEDIEIKNTIERMIR